MNTFLLYSSDRHIDTSLISVHHPNLTTLTKNSIQNGRQGFALQDNNVLKGLYAQYYLMTYDHIIYSILSYY